jgi:hypothetical protein
VAGTLTVFGAEPRPATLTLVSLDPGRRLARALGVLALCWGGALVAVFIPVAHFVLVPGLAIAGVVWAVLRMRERERLLRVHGTCPRCGRVEDFVPAGGGRSLAVTCPGCFNSLGVSVARTA